MAHTVAVVEAQQAIKKPTPRKPRKVVLVNLDGEEPQAVPQPSANSGNKTNATVAAPASVTHLNADTEVNTKQMQARFT